MGKVWTRNSAVAALMALVAAGLAAAPAEAGTRKMGKPAAQAKPIERSGFVLTANAPVAAGLVQLAYRTNAPTQTQVAQFGDGEIEYIEGPSWTYQTTHRGPVIEMGALGGGTTENAPFLAHVALAWQF